MEWPSWSEKAPSYQRSGRHVARARGVHAVTPARTSWLGCFSGSQDSGPIARLPGFVAFRRVSPCYRRVSPCYRCEPHLLRSSLWVPFVSWYSPLGFRLAVLVKIHTPVSQDGRGFEIRSRDDRGQIISAVPSRKHDLSSHKFLIVVPIENLLLERVIESEREPGF